MHGGEWVRRYGRPTRHEAARVDAMMVRQGGCVWLQVLVTEVVRVVCGTNAGARVVRMLLQLDEGGLRSVDKRRATVHLLV